MFYRLGFPTLLSRPAPKIWHLALATPSSLGSPPPSDAKGDSMGSRVRQLSRQVMAEFLVNPPSMMAAVIPVYDPENPAWPTAVDSAYDSATGAISSTVVPLLLRSTGTATSRLAWHGFASAHPLEAGVITAHMQAESVDPLQALYHLVERRVISGYRAQRHETGSTLKVVVSCPLCSAVFEPWENLHSG